MEGPIFGGAYVRREICISKSIGLACRGKEINHFCFVLLCIRGQFPSTSPRGAYILRGDLKEGFLRYDFGGLIFGGAYFRNFMVFPIVVQQPPLIIDGLDWFVTRSCDTCMK